MVAPPDGWASSPAIAALADGGFALSWVGVDAVDGTFDIFTQTFSAMGEAAGVAVSTQSDAEMTYEGQPAIAAHSDGTFSIAWQNPGIWVRSYGEGAGGLIGSAGQPIDLPVTIRLADNDGSEHLVSVTIGSVPEGFTFNAGASAGSGSWVVDRSTPAGAAFLDGLAAGTAHFTVTAPAGYHGDLALSFSAVSEEIATGDTATGPSVQLPMTFTDEVNAAPVAVADSLHAIEDQAASFLQAELTGNDGDADGDPLSVVGLSGATHGKVAFNPDGSIRFTPDADFNGISGFDYLVSDGHGGSATGHVQIDVAAVNDAPIISVGTGDTASAALVEGDTGRTATGTLTAIDADLPDSLSASVVGFAKSGMTSGLTASDAALQAMLKVTAGSIAADPGSTHNLGWSFDSGFEAFDYLASGETVTLTWTLEITDGSGTSDTQDVTVTITGTNDAPAITFVPGDDLSVALDESDAGLSFLGRLTVVDADLSDTVTASVLGVEASGATAGLNIGYAELRSMLGLTYGSIAADPGSAHNLLWAFDSLGHAFDYLAAGETLNLTYAIQVSDGRATSPGEPVTVTVSISGTDDAPMISVGTHESAAASVTDSSAPLVATGTLTVVDPDRSDNVEARVVSVTGLPALADPAGLLDMLSLQPGHLSADPGAGTGNLTWTFTAGHAAFDWLAAGETQLLTFKVRVTDESGASDDQDVTITVHGTNDAPVILGSSPAATAVVEIADGAAGENSAVLSRSGTLFFADADRTDSHGFHVTPQGDGYLGSFTLGASDEHSGTLGWSFSVNDSALEQLGQGEVLRQYYQVGVDDGHGGTASETIEVDLIGSNDAAILSSANVVLVQGASPVAAAGLLSLQDVDGPAAFQPLSNLHGHYGSLTLTAGGSWSYLADSAYPGLGSADVLTDSFIVHAADGTPTTVTVSIAGSDAVAIARLDRFVTDEAHAIGTGLSLFADNGFGVDVGSGLRIGSVNGQAGNVGHQIQLASGALLEVDADGTFHYDPNHAFDTLTLASGAMNQFAYDSFNYALEDGSSATVLVRVNGLNSAEDLLIGSLDGNAITGLDRDDMFRLEQGDHDTAWGLGGNDGFYFGATLDAGDQVDGGGGTDTIAVQGSTYVTLGDITNVEVLALISGTDPSFGDHEGNLYDYDIATSDGNVADGETLTIIGTGLQAGEDVHFDGSAETDGNFRIFAGEGTDGLVAGDGSDGFFFGSDGNLTGADHVDGGAGVDTLALRGDYTGADAVVFQDGSLSNVEVLALLSGHTNEYSGQIVPTGFDYDVTMADGNVAAGQRLDVIAGLLGSDESVTFDGSAETDGAFRIISGSGNDSLAGGAGNDLIYGGLGADALAGGAGADTYVYLSAAESTSTGYDTITGFDWHVDRIDAPGGARAFTQAGSGALSTASFDADLTADLGALGAGQAALFTASSGTLAGHVFAVIDVDGQAGYRPGADLVIELVNPVTPIDVTAAVIV